jgi:glycosyltransferase involved in cell wall biosynthesis
MIKVLQVLEATVGGTRRHLLSLVEGLDKSRFQVEIAAPLIRQGTIDDTGFIDEIKALDVRIHRVNMRRSIQPVADLRALWVLTNLIRREKYDIVHVHSSKAGFLGRIAARLNGVPTVYTPNGFYFLSNMPTAKVKTYLLLERLAGRLTDCLIAVSESEREQAVNHGLISPARIVVIPNAIDIQRFRPDPVIGRQLRIEFGVPDDAMVVGTVARFIEQKDPITFIRAARLIADRMPNVRFLWCGEGPMRHEIEQLAAELELTSVIHFLGYRKDIANLMNVFDMFVLTSIFEGLPYTILEAMAVGLPLVVTDVVGNRDVVIDGQNGLIVVPRSPEEVANAVSKLFQDREKRLSMGQESYYLVTKHYRIQDMVSNIEGVYEDLLQSNQLRLG